MPEPIPLPAGCTWWAIGDLTDNPPEDEKFLRRLAEVGFATYIGPSGLVGARTSSRAITIIHRGRGRRWDVALREDEVDRHIIRLTMLPAHSEAAIAWLNGESLTNVRKMFEV